MPGLNVAVQMDPMTTVDIDGDSTFALMLEAQSRGHTLWHYEVPQMWLDGATLKARAHPVTVRREPGDFYRFGEPETLNLGEMDVVLMRQDPPFDMAYITATHLLEHIHPKTLVVNNPASVRNAPEKLLVMRFPELMPPTMIARDAAAIREFRARHGDIIIKPLFGNGGAGVFRVRPGDENFNSLLEMFSQRSREPVIAQRYLPEVRKGDKRIILIDGEPVGEVTLISVSQFPITSMPTKIMPSRASSGPMISQISMSRLVRPAFIAWPPTCMLERASPCAGTRSMAPTALPSIRMMRLSPLRTSGR